MRTLPNNSVSTVENPAPSSAHVSSTSYRNLLSYVVTRWPLGSTKHRLLKYRSGAPLRPVDGGGKGRAHEG